MPADIKFNVGADGRQSEKKEQGVKSKNAIVEIGKKVLKSIFNKGSEKQLPGKERE